MGLFDDFRCKYPLPVAGANELHYQTKDTPAQWCSLYEIREDGTLWHNIQKEEWVHVGNFTGEIRFYTSFPIGELLHEGWIEWSSYFHNGKLQQINLIEHRTEPRT